MNLVQSERRNMRAEEIEDVAAEEAEKKDAQWGGQTID